MAKVKSWVECRKSLEKVAEGTNRSVILLNATIEKMGLLMAAIREFRHGKA